MHFSVKLLLVAFALMLGVIVWTALAVGIPLARDLGTFASSWKSEVFYEKKASLLFEGHELELRNGGVRRLIHGASTYVTGAQSASHFSRKNNQFFNSNN